jgi:hypothetical protein
MHRCAGCGRLINSYGITCDCGHYWDQSRFGALGIDLLDGDVTIGLGNGLVEDLSTGQVELQIAPGIDIPLDGGFDSGFGF